MSQTWFEHLRAEPRTGIEATDDFATMPFSNQINPKSPMNVPESVGQRMVLLELPFKDETDPSWLGGRFPSCMYATSMHVSLVNI
jgi:hypothetical protein